jgi:hypothetical protein
LRIATGLVVPSFRTSASRVQHAQPHQDFDTSGFEIHVKRLGDEPDSEDPARKVDPTRRLAIRKDC